MQRIPVYLLVAAVLFALFVWPTLYRYDFLGNHQVLVRINRITGTVEYLKSDIGWVAAGSGPTKLQQLP